MSRLVDQFGQPIRGKNDFAATGLEVLCEAARGVFSFDDRVRAMRRVNELRESVGEPALTVGGAVIGDRISVSVPASLSAKDDE